MLFLLLCGIIINFFFFFFFNDTATTEIYTLSYTTLFRSSRRHRWISPRARAPWWITWWRSGIARHQDRKSTRLNSSHGSISYAVFCLKKKIKTHPVMLRNVDKQRRDYYT